MFRGAALILRYRSRTSRCATGRRAARCAYRAGGRGWCLGAGCWSSRRFEALRGEVAHDCSHTFKPPTATVVVVVALAALLVAELATLMSSHPPQRAISLGVSFFATAGGHALILRLSQREELRADRKAAELLGSAGPVIAMLEQLPRARHRR